MGESRPTNFGRMRSWPFRSKLLVVGAMVLFTAACGSGDDGSVATEAETTLETTTVAEAADVTTTAGTEPTESIEASTVPETSAVVETDPPVEPTGSVTVAVVTEPPDLELDDDAAQFEFTGTPAGVVSLGDELTVDDLDVGSYSTTMVEPAPTLELVDATCDDGGSPTESTTDVEARSAVINLDADEVVRCVFTVSTDQSVGNESDEATDGNGDDVSGSLGPAAGGSSGPPEPDIDKFPEPVEPIPDPVDDPQSSVIPREGPWKAENFPGTVNCSGGFSLPISTFDIDFGTLQVLDGGSTLVGTPDDSGSEPITVEAVAEYPGIYYGGLSFEEQGASFVFDFYLYVFDEEYIVGYLDAFVDLQGLSCIAYRPFDLTFTG